MFWNLLQDHRFFKLRDHADTLERRVKALESRNGELQDLMHKLLYALEDHLNQDINNDKQIGKPTPRRISIKSRIPNKMKSSNKGLVRTGDPRTARPSAQP